jgi:hypothetical protein
MDNRSEDVRTENEEGNGVQHTNKVNSYTKIIKR